VWVVGGVGLVGQGITRALLKAGATVVVNSRSEERLGVLADALGHPERLVPLHASMLPKDAKLTVMEAVSRTGGKLDHVVSHASVRWWDASSGDDGAMVNELTSRSDNFLDVDPRDFAEAMSKSAEVHFCAAHHLLPHLTGEDASYTFVTGGSREMAWGQGKRVSPRGPLAQINAYGVWGLAAAMRGELQASNSPVRVAELRMGLSLGPELGDANKPRWVSDREVPLSHDLGQIVAGIAAAGPKTEDAGFRLITSDADVQALKESFPVAADLGGGVYFTPDL